MRPAYDTVSAFLSFILASFCGVQLLIYSLLTKPERSTLFLGSAQCSYKIIDFLPLQQRNARMGEDTYLPD